MQKVTRKSNALNLFNGTVQNDNSFISILPHGDTFFPVKHNMRMFAFFFFLLVTSKIQFMPVKLQKAQKCVL